MAQPFIDREGRSWAAREWRNLGGNVSVAWRPTGANGRRLLLRLDTTGEVQPVTRRTPSGYDATEQAFYTGREASGYFRFCFGPDYQPAKDDTQ